MNDENKERIPIWLYPSTIQRMDGWLKEDNCKSRSEFIEKALRFYMGYRSCEDNTTYLSKAFVSVLQGVIRNETNRIASLQYKLALEVAMMMNVLASGLEISKADLRALRGRCIKELRRTNFKLSFDEAVAFQNDIHADENMEVKEDPKDRDE